MKEYAAGMTWGEGPRWQRGALWLSDTQGGKLWTDHDGPWRGIPLNAIPNGLWFLPDGRLVGAMMHQRRIGVWTGEQFDTYADLSAVATGPLGDMVGDPHGNLYVDDVGFAAHAGEPLRPGRLLRVAADGAVQVAAEDVEFPNGLAFAGDGRTLVVAETTRQRLTAFTVADDGALTDRRTYADLAHLIGDDVRPDGIWATQDGVWVATTTGHAVALVRENELVTSIGTGTLLPIACCSDGGNRLFVTLADTHGLPLGEAMATKAVHTTVALLEVAKAGDTS
ncbi:SMP-30/gluconolactonase/LRE family protein [Streptomyces sp. NPDC046915]|uniref:SMP-30/gluconolactonase/LRE family protein n=1 Tax=Streptomyces sp. NPDC046915 TaxID=3155257 RepID=UPI00340AEA70